MKYLHEIEISFTGHIIIGRHKIVRSEYRQTGGILEKVETYHVYIPCIKTKKGGGLHGLGFIWGNDLDPKTPNYNTLKEALEAIK